MPSPEQVNWAKFRASAVILAALMILGTLVYLLTGGTFLQPKAQIYLYLPDATGVAPGSPVRVDGISVGKVSLVELSGSNEPNRVVKVTMTIERDRLTSITSDSTARDSFRYSRRRQVHRCDQRDQRHAPDAGRRTAVQRHGDLMQRLDISQFQKQMHQIELVLDEIEQGTSPLGRVHQGRSDLQRSARQDHRTAARNPRCGRHHDGGRASALHGRAVPQGHRTPAPVGRQPGTPSGGAGKRRGAAARYPAV